MLVATGHSHCCVAFFAILNFELPRRKPERYPKQINSLGDHIIAHVGWISISSRSRLADHIGVHEMTITGTVNATPAIPELRYIPGIIQFLGYDPLPPATTLTERLATAHVGGGAVFRQRKMAAKLGVIPQR